MRKKKRKKKRRMTRRRRRRRRIAKIGIRRRDGQLDIYTAPVLQTLLNATVYYQDEAFGV